MSVVFKKSALAVMITAALTTGGLVGCSGDDTSIVNDDVISVKATATFNGIVYDMNGSPLRGASITLWADRAYRTNTDASGNYLINVNMGDIVAASGGGSSEVDTGTLNGLADPSTEQVANDTITRNFSIDITHNSYADVRQDVQFNGTIGYTDGSGAVVLLSQTGSQIPTVQMVPYVDNFTFDVYAGDALAAGAVVTLTSSTSGNNNDASTLGGSFSFGEGDKTFVADENGVVSITAADKLAAGIYGYVVAPYDADADGVYEYSSSIRGNFFDVSLVPGSSILQYEVTDATTGKLAITQTETAPSINLRDALRNDLEVVYLSIEGVDNIPVAQADTFSITVMFNRPLIEETLAEPTGLGSLFSLTDGNSLPVPYTVTNTGNYLYTITPDETLTPSANGYDFTVNQAVSYKGSNFSPDLVAFTQEFNIYDPNATLAATITPGLDIDDDSSYKVDADRFLTGAPSDVNFFAPSQTFSFGFAQDDLSLSWAVSAEEEGGYAIWVKDTNLSDASWFEVENDLGLAVNTTYNDGQFIEATVVDLLGQNQFLAGEALQVVVAPININGYSFDPNTDNTIVGLRLADNWGPEIVTGNGFFTPDPDGINPPTLSATTGFVDGVTNCDATEVDLAVSEPLQDVALVAEYAAGEFGARAVSGSCFTVSAVYWTDNDLADPAVDTAYPSNRGFIRVDLTPTMTTTTAAAATAGDTEVTLADASNFAVGNAISIDGAANSVTGFAGNMVALAGGLADDVASGATVNFTGPIASGYTSVDGTLNSNSNFHDQRIIVDDIAGIGANDSRLTAPASAYVVGAAGSTLTLDTTLVVSAADASVSGFSVGATAAAAAGGPVGNTALTAPVAIGVSVLPVGSEANFAAGDVIVIGFNTVEEEQLTVASVALGSITTTANTTIAHGGPATVQETVSFATNATYGYPMIVLNTVAGMKPGSALTVDDGAETDTVNVVSAFIFAGTSRVVIDDFLRDSADVIYVFGAGSDFSNDSARSPDAIQVNLQDRSGNDSSATDTTGDGTANGDQLGHETTDSGFGTF